MENSEEQENEDSEKIDLLNPEKSLIVQKVQVSDTTEDPQGSESRQKNSNNKTPGYGYSEHTKPDAERGIGVLHPVHHSAGRSLPF